MTELAQRVARTIAERRLLEDGEAAVVAVSGGVDSMALLHLLRAFAAQRRWRLVVAHFNHQLRGAAADADQRFVARAAKKLGLDFKTESADVREFAQRRKISIEMAARSLRHEFLARTARSLGIRKIVLAHHADDQVELFFLRLFRGAGTQGLGGMEWNAPSPAGWEISLLRPLLLETKSALENYAKEKKIPFREDTTNREPDILRNRIRQELLPLLRRNYQPQIDSAVLRSMELVQTEGDFVSAEAVKWARNRSGVRFDSLHVALQRRVVQMELLRHGVIPQFDHVEQLRRQTNRWVTVRAGLVCRRKPSGELEARPAQSPSFNANEAVVNLESRVKRAVFDGLHISWRITRGAKLPVNRDAQTECFDASAVGSKITLRHWRAGDRFQPIGMGAPVKLQDWFVNQKISRERRHTLVVATTEAGEIFCVEGLRIGERFKVTPQSDWTLQWKWSR